MVGRVRSRLNLQREDDAARQCHASLSPTRQPSPASGGPTAPIRKRESSPGLAALEAGDSGFSTPTEPLSPSAASETLRASATWLEIDAPLPLEARILEVGTFLAWAGCVAGTLAQYPMVWVAFWEHVCGLGGNDNYLLASRRPWLAPLWALWGLLLHFCRHTLYQRLPAEMVPVLANGEVFILASLAMTVCANFASYVHTPGARLFDVGFALIPEQAVDSPWRPLSDLLTAALPILALGRSLFLGRRQRCRLVAAWLRLIAITYTFRCLSVTLTSLPGPAPHCGSLASYGPPRGWHDIATRMGPMLGDYRTCGDLLFSGHAAVSTATLLLLVRSLRGSPRLALWKGLAALYLLGLCVLTIAGRKHYTVDVMLGVLVAALAVFRFEHSWAAPHAGAAGLSLGLGGSAVTVTHYDPETEKKMEVEGLLLYI